MSEESKHPVVDETLAPAQPGATVDGARNEGDTLEDLLKTYEEQTTRTVAEPPQPPVAATTQSDPNAVVAKLQAIEGRLAKAEEIKFKQDMEGTVSAIRGDLPAEVFDNGLVEAWLDSQARQDPRLQKAWLERDNNPKQFERVKAELGKSFAKKFSKLPDPAITEDRAAVSAAVRGASSRAPAEPPPNLSRMSNSEYRQKVIQDYGFDPGV